MRGEYMASFGELLKELREDKKISQKELAKKIYVTVGTISNYENNQHYPDIEKLIMLADYLMFQQIIFLGAQYLLILQIFFKNKSCPMFPSHQ